MGLKVCLANPIPERGILAVVKVEPTMVESVARCSVDDGRVCIVFAVMDEDRPDVDEDKQAKVCEFLERE